MKKTAVYYEVLNFTPENLAFLKEQFAVTTLRDPSVLNSEVLHECRVLFAPMGFRCDRDVIEHAPGLEVIATCTTGTSHIDVEAARRRGVDVVSLHGEADMLNAVTPTAELTIGLVVAVTRNLFAAVDVTRRGQWRRTGFGAPAMLSRMTLGIAGMGRLGRMVAKTAHAMGMKVSYYNPRVVHESDWPYTRARTLEELVGANDVITVHAGPAENNRHMFNAALFSRFKPGSYFVNTARGEFVDSNALIEALDKRIIAGAALDVLDGEFEPGFDRHAQDHPLLRYAQRHGNLIITPHIAGSTKDAWTTVQRFVIDKVCAACVARPVQRRRKAS
jgi:D-3-phosphoglycerate dehydrogenase